MSMLSEIVSVLGAIGIGGVIGAYVQSHLQRYMKESTQWGLAGH